MEIPIIISSMDEALQNVERINAIATRHIEGLQRVFERAGLPPNVRGELERLHAVHIEVDSLIRKSVSPV